MQMYMTLVGGAISDALVGGVCVVASIGATGISASDRSMAVSLCLQNYAKDQVGSTLVYGFCSFFFTGMGSSELMGSASGFAGLVNGYCQGPILQ